MKDNPAIPEGVLDSVGRTFQTGILTEPEFGVLWTQLVENLPREHGFEPLSVEGRLPSDLEGTLYRVGPGLYDSFGRRYQHLFDADGAVTAVRFAKGQALGATRVIETKELLRERVAGRPLFFGFGTLPPGFPRSLKPKNVANTNVLHWSGRLFALYEPRLPTEINCADLKAMGETDLGRVLRGTFSAHPHFLPSRKAIYNFGLRVTPFSSYVDLYELPLNGNARRIVSLPFPGVFFLHDFIVTERYAIFFGAPVQMKWRNLFLRRTIAESLTWKPELGTSIMVVPLDDPAHPIRWTADALMLFHFANAFERGEEIIVDFVRYPDYDLTARLATEIVAKALSTDTRSRLSRATIDLKRKSLRWQDCWSRTCEFPIVASSRLTGRHRYVYLLALSPDPQSCASAPTRVAKVDTETGRTWELTFGSECYPSEALFVARLDSRSEDDGYLLTLVYDGRRRASYVAVLDALDLGILARVWFDHPIPMTFHGTWTSPF